MPGVSQPPRLPAAAPATPAAAPPPAGGDKPNLLTAGLPRTTSELGPRTLVLPDANHPERRDVDGEQVIQTSEVTTPGTALPLGARSWRSRAEVSESIDLRDDAGDTLHIDLTYRLETRPAELGDLPDLWIHTERKALLTVATGEHAGATIVGQARLAPGGSPDPKAAIGAPSLAPRHWAQVYLAEAAQYVTVLGPGGQASLRADAAGHDVLAYDDPLRLLVGLKRLLKQQHVAGHGGDVARRHASAQRLLALAERGRDVLERERASIATYHDPHPGRIAPIRWLVGDIANWLADNAHAGRDDTDDADQLRRAHDQLDRLLAELDHAQPAARSQVADALDAPVRFLERTGEGMGEGIAMAVDSVVLGVDAVGQATGLGTFAWHPISKYGQSIEASGSDPSTAIVTMINGFADEWSDALERARHGDYRSLTDVSLDSLLLIDGARAGAAVAVEKVEALAAKVGRIARTAHALAQSVTASADVRALAAAMADGADAFVARVRAGGLQMSTAGGGRLPGPGGGISAETLAEAAKAAKEAFTEARGAAHAAADDQGAQQAAKSAAGNAAASATKKYKFEVVERSAVEKAIREAAGAAAEKAYRASLTAGEKPTQANVAANKAAKVAAEEVAKDQARHFATQAAARAIEQEGAFEMGNLKPDAQNQLSSFKAGTTAGRARQLPAELEKLSEKEFLARMAKEPCTTKTVKIQGPPPQVMHVYEYPDGTVVRYKPLGDQYRSEPTYSVEVKKDPTLPDRDRQTTAFKVDPLGRPIPKGPYELKNPYPEDSFQADVFEREVMNAGHRTLRK